MAVPSRYNRLLILISIALSEKIIVKVFSLFTESSFELVHSTNVISSKIKVLYGINEFN